MTTSGTPDFAAKAFVMEVVSRQNYLDIADVDLELFKSLRRRGQVPRLGGGWRRPEEDETDSRDVYLLEDALMLAAADHLVTQNSFTRSAAQRVIESFPELLVSDVPRSLAGEDIWYAILSWDFGAKKRAYPDNPEDKAHWHWAYVGTFEEVIAAIKKEQKEVRTKHKGTVDNIAMFNLSGIVNRCKDRAIQLGITPSFFGSEPPAGASKPTIQKRARSKRP
jgi:hypothetical protein